MTEVADELNQEAKDERGNTSEVKYLINMLCFAAVFFMTLVGKMQSRVRREFCMHSSCMFYSVFTFLNLVFQKRFDLCFCRKDDN